jgi:hypothetical protein
MAHQLRNSGHTAEAVAAETLRKLLSDELDRRASGDARPDDGS